MHPPFDLPLPGFVHVDCPHWYRYGGDMDPHEFGLKAARSIEDKILELGADNVGAFIGEPIMGAGGVLVPPDSYWPEVQRICREHNVLLIADEVICGFGRTGNWFACDHFAIDPDFMTMAKGLSSGYLPISGVMVHDRIAQVMIEDGGEFQHGFTYSGHPVAAAVALENISILEREKIVEKVGVETGPYLQARLRELTDHPLVGEVRGIGMMAAVEIVKDKATHESFPEDMEMGGKVREAAWENGLLVRACGDSMVLSPPLIVTKEQVDDICATLRAALDVAAREAGV
jgi:putrescine aminotransferase